MSINLISSRIVATLVAATLAISTICASASAATVTWDIGSATWDTVNANWVGPTTYTDASMDDAVFDDIDGLGGTITVQGGGVTPISTTVNGALGYTFTGGSILGGAFAKSGSGTTTLRASNSFSGVTLSGGTVDYDAANRIGAGTINFTGDATLFLNKGGVGAAAVTNPISVTNGVTATI